MSLLFDQNLSRRLPTRWRRSSPAQSTWSLPGSRRRPIGRCGHTRRFTDSPSYLKDADFQKLAKALGPPPKVVWLHVGNGPTRHIETLLRSRTADIRAFLADPTSALLELP